jgi:hypothetical protein
VTGPEHPRAFAILCNDARQLLQTPNDHGTDAASGAHLVLRRAGFDETGLIQVASLRAAKEREKLMKRFAFTLFGVVAGLALSACGAEPNEGTSVDPAAASSSTEELGDRCAAICRDTSDPYSADNCECCHQHLKNPTCYQ